MLTRVYKQVATLGILPDQSGDNVADFGMDFKSAAIWGHSLAAIFCALGNLDAPAVLDKIGRPKGGALQLISRKTCWLAL